MSGIVVDLFAGPGGWDEGARAAGLRSRILGVEWDEQACETARAAGHERVQADVADIKIGELIAEAIVLGLIASPPCQAWSRSGKRGGLLDQPAIFAHVAACIAAEKWLPYDRAGWHDERSPLVLEVLRWVWALQPQWIACEQVEDVLPFWHEVARWLRTQGYSAWAGVLNAEEYGVPQTRRRAILVARRDGVPAGPPAATHRRYFPPKRAKAADLVAGDDLFGTELLPWVSMADALGWGIGNRPAWTVTAGGTETGGAEVFGNANCRAQLRDWVVRTGNNSMSSSRTGSRAGDGGVVPYERPVTDPAPTLDTNVGGKWKIMAAGQAGEGRPRDPSAPAPTITGKATATWVHERPATTVQGDPRIGRPGHKDRSGGESQFDRDSVQVSVTEAAVLQGFRPDYPWAGNKSAQYRQVGDAVPPPLARAVVAPLLAPEVNEVAA